MKKWFYFKAQLWKISKDGTLRNKLRDWKYSDDSSIVVPDRIPGFIEIKIANIEKVLTVRSGSEVGFETKMSPIPGKQNWTLEHPDKNGWRRIRNLENNLYLSTNYNGYFTVLAVEEKGNRFLQFS